MKRLIALALLLLLANTGTALAVPSITGVSASPSSRNVPYSGGAAVTVVWRINRTGPVPFTIAADTGVFKATTISNIPWGTVPAFSRSFTAPQTVITFTETFLVPQAVMRKALETNNGNFVLMHNFSDDNFATSFPGVVNLHVTGGGAGPLGVQQLTLTFSNGASVATVPKGATLGARALVTATGTGQLEGIWELNDSGSSGASFFRPLRQVTVTLAGQRNTTILSPPLPTKEEGRYDLRFRVVTPAMTGIPDIIYFVTGKPSVNGLPRISTTGPKEGAAVSSGTTFSWKDVKGAAGYKIEVFSGDAETPAGKMMLKADKAEARLSALTLSELPPGPCRWRVVAFDRDGRDIAASALQSARIAP